MRVQQFVHEALFALSAMQQTIEVYIRTYVYLQYIRSTSILPSCSSTRLAYEDLSAAQKRAEQQQLRDLNPHQQKQLERLGMGVGRVR